jgi:uncharacterized OB-fold protein
VIEQVPLPALDGEAEPYWRAAAEGRLVIQACASCGRLRHPPRPMCPVCRSVQTRWEELSGRGTIWSFVVPHPPLLPAFAPYAPYNVAVVALDEEPRLRIVGNVVAHAGAPINSVDPATIAIGEPVRVVFEPVADIGLPRFIREG